MRMCNFIYWTMQILQTNWYFIAQIFRIFYWIEWIPRGKIQVAHFSNVKLLFVWNFIYAFIQMVYFFCLFLCFFVSVPKKTIYSIRTAKIQTTNTQCIKWSVYLYFQVFGRLNKFDIAFNFGLVIFWLEVVNLLKYSGMV